MSGSSSGQWGTQDSGASANPSVAHAADGERPIVAAESSREPSDSVATHSPSQAFGTSLPQPLTELQRNVASIARHFAKQQDEIHKTLNSLKLLDIKAINIDFPTFDTDLTRTPVELQRNVASIARRFADQQHGWHKTISDLSTSFKQQFTEAFNALNLNGKTTAMPLHTFLSDLAKRQDGQRNLLNPITSEFTRLPIDDTNDYTVQKVGEIQDSPRGVRLAYKLETIREWREWIVAVLILATFIVMLVGTLSEPDDAVIIDIDKVIINVCESCTQISYHDFILNRNN